MVYAEAIDIEVTEKDAASPGRPIVKLFHVKDSENHWQSGPNKVAHGWLGGFDRSQSPHVDITRVEIRVPPAANGKGVDVELTLDVNASTSRPWLVKVRVMVMYFG